MFNVKKIVLFSLATFLSAQFSTVMAPTTSQVEGDRCNLEFPKPTNATELREFAERLRRMVELLRQQPLFQTVHYNEKQLKQYADTYDSVMRFLGLQITFSDKSDDLFASFLGVKINRDLFIRNPHESVCGFNERAALTQELFWECPIREHLMLKFLRPFQGVFFRDVLSLKKEAGELSLGIFQACFFQFNLEKEPAMKEAFKASGFLELTERFHQYYKYVGIACVQFAQYCDFVADRFDAYEKHSLLLAADLSRPSV